MQLGVDFNGTLIRYAVCCKSGACDGIIVSQEESLEGARQVLKEKIKRNKSPYNKFYIMKQTTRYERLYDKNVEDYYDVIINTVSDILECSPSMRRGNKLVWCDSSGDRIVYLDLNEHNNRGSLEVYEGGKCVGNYNNGVILDYTDEDSPTLVFNKDALIDFLRPYTKIGTI